VEVLRLLDEGHSVNSIAKLYGEGRYKTINKLRHQLDDGEIVLSEGKYMLVDIAQNHSGVLPVYCDGTSPGSNHCFASSRAIR
jgi:hypothetical protein